MKERTKTVIACLVIAAGAVFIAVGVSRGEAFTVLQKAITTCLECIGLG